MTWLLKRSEGVSESESASPVLFQSGMAREYLIIITHVCEFEWWDALFRFLVCFYQPISTTNIVLSESKTPAQAVVNVLDRLPADPSVPQWVVDQAADWRSRYAGVGEERMTGG